MSGDAILILACVLLAVLLFAGPIWMAVTGRCGGCSRTAKWWFNYDGEPTPLCDECVRDLEHDHGAEVVAHFNTNGTLTRIGRSYRGMHRKPKQENRKK